MATVMTGYRDVDEASNYPGSSYARALSVRSPSLHEPLEETPPPKGYSRKEMFVLVVCSCSSMFMHMGLSTIPLVLPIEITRKGVPYEFCGAIFSVFAISIVILEPFQAKILPWIGTRNSFVYSALLGGVCYVSFAMIDFANTVPGFATPAIIIRFVEGFYYAVLITASNVIVCLTFPDRASFAFGVLEGFVGAGFTLGPALGGVLFKFCGFVAPFLLIGACLLVTAGLGYCALEQITGLNLAARKKEKKRLIRDTAFIGCSLLTMAAGIVWGTFETALEPYLATYEKGPLVEGLVFAIAYLAYGAMAPLWGFIFRKVEMDYRWILVGPLVVALCWMVLGPIPPLSFIGKRLWLDTVCLFVLNTAIAYIFVFSFDTMLKRAIFCGMEGDVATYALVVAGFFSSIYIGEAIGPIIGGYLTANKSFQAVATVAVFIQFAAFALGAIIMLIAWNKIIRRLRRKLHQKFPRWVSPPEDPSVARESGETSPLHSSIADEEEEYMNIFQPPTPSRKTGAIRYLPPKSYGSIC
ncbi:MFS-type transporter SLC18B1-like [Paramacrobiotus metropolitanus]|uniref:MFS-type transporter SLC18B1-like n=1 Tax=Paramacrobiotus metropolitanus TaxID=2943436 RepID=UPI002445F29D|nr:MFS-type transporter SLC18B1-like [Paramacrobiotus metropolitanus]